MIEANKAKYAGNFSQLHQQSRQFVDEGDNHQGSFDERQNAELIESRLMQPTAPDNIQRSMMLEANRNDSVEGTKDFNNAYDKLVKKFYHEEGANLLIPADDMVVHEYNQNYKARIDIEDRQRKIKEAADRKALAIEEARLEK